jgi:glycosyltransferase involved in cell wall biosynthesis
MKNDKNEILYIVMPAYNEQDNIKSVIAQWYPVIENIGSGSFLLIVNDGSKDKTYEILLELQKDYPQLKVIDKPNSGHGATIMLAYKNAIEAGANFIFQTDSDGQTDPDEFRLFWENRHKYDFQIGNRCKRKDGQGRIFVTRVLRIILWSIFRVNIVDANTPFRLMNAERLKAIMEFVPKDFFLANVLIITIAVKWKESCIWHPITFKPRQAGVNSINFRRIIKIGWKSLKDFRMINKNLKNKKI